MQDDRVGWIQGTGWLWVGLAMCLLTALGGLAPLTGWLDSLLPAGWSRWLAALGWVGIGCALYFRSHWAATLSAYSADGPEAHDAARRLGDVAAEIDRSAHVIDDNLVELGTGTAQHELYLDGARAHAGKLKQNAERLRGIARRLTEPQSVD